MAEFSASILAANHAYIARDVGIVEENGISQFHIDVTDGHYTENIIFGDKLVADLRKETNAILDVHLATYNLSVLTDIYIKAGADIITFQYETCEHPLRLIKQIKDSGKKACISFTPSTTFETIKFFISEVDMINILSVEPGVGGQIFNIKVLDKINKVTNYKKQYGYETKIAIDGGINDKNLQTMLDLGADVLIIGSAIFSGNISDNIKNLNKIINIA